MGSLLPELRIAGIPVRIHPTFFILAVLLAGSLQGASLGFTIALLASWTVVLLISILFHELGHALAFRAFRIHSRIEVHGMGGTTTPSDPSGLTPGRIILVSLAGPLTGLVLGGLALAATRAAGGAGVTGLAGITIAEFIYVNLAVSVFNLLPIHPMDGAQTVGAALSVVAPRRADQIALGISLLTAAAVVIVAVSQGAYWIAFVTGWIWLAGQSVQRRRAQLNRDEPLRARLQEVASLLQEDATDRAASGARAILGEARSPATQAEAARLLTLAGVRGGRSDDAEEGLRRFPRATPPGAYLEGLVALTRGDAPAAIRLLTDAFAAAPGDAVGAALVSAYLLAGQIGEAERFVGGPQAARLGPSSHMALVAGVLERGHPEEAARRGEAAFATWPDPLLAYTIARAWARSGKSEAAAGWLERSIQLGFTDRPRLAADPDLASVRGTTAYEQAIELSRDPTSPDLAPPQPVANDRGESRR